MAITHTKVATIADEAGAEVNKGEWNADHTIAAGTITPAQTQLGRPSWTYLITVLSGTYTAVKFDGTTVSTGADFVTVFDAVITDKGATDPAVIEFGEGIFDIKSKIFATASNITLQGQGKGVTVFSAHEDLPDGDEAINFGTNPGVTASVHLFHISNVAIRDNDFTLDTGTEEDQFVQGEWVMIRDDGVISTGEQKSGEFHRVHHTIALPTDDSGKIEMDGEAYKAFTTGNVMVHRLNTMTENITIRDITFTDARALPTSGQVHYLEVKFNRNTNILNCEFNNVWRSALRINCCVDNHIIGCSFERIRSTDTSADLHYGAVINTCQNTMVDNCHFYSVRHSVALVSGIRDDSGSDVGQESGEMRGFVQQNCTIINCSNSGLDTHPGCINPCFIGNFVSDKSRDQLQDNFNTFGVQVRSPCTIIGNIFENLNSGVHFSNADASGTIIKGNRFTDLKQEGVFIKASATVSNVIIEGNYFDNCLLGGIVQENADDLLIESLITGNFFKGLTPGISLDDASELFIHGNMFVSVTNAIVLADTNDLSANISIKDNFYSSVTTELTDGTPTGDVFRSDSKVVSGTFSSSHTTSPTESVVFFALNGGGGGSVTATEANVDHIFDFAFVIKRVSIWCGTNGKDEASTYIIRDDGVDVTNTNISIPAGSTGQFTTGVITEAIASGSACNVERDTSASGDSGSIAIQSYSTGYILT